MTETILWTSFVIGYFLTWLLIPQVLLRRTVHTSSAVAWIMSIIFMPYLGAILFMLLGSIRFERRSVQKREASEQIDRQVPPWSQEHLASPEDVGSWYDLARLGQRLSRAQLLVGNDVDVLPDTKRTLELIAEAIEAAERWIHVEFYIWRQDRAGSRLGELLAEKARQGLEVRFLYDGIGSILLSRRFLRTMRDAGVHLAQFTSSFQIWHPANLNLRNHRKIVVVDGKCGFTGGMNIGDEYIHRTKSYGRWRDTQLRIKGPAALQLQQVFAQDWYYATGEALTEKKYYPDLPRQEGSICQVIADGPDNEVDTYYALMVAAVGRASKRVTLSTPYFVPPDGVAMALETAAHRGVEVHIMIAGRANFPWTLRAGRSYYDALLRAGAEIYEYQAGLFHPKILTVDGCWSLIGTPNCDFRSFYLNFEVAVASFDEQLAAQLEREFQEDCHQAERIDWDTFRHRGTSTVLQEKFWRLFAPIL